MFDLIKRIRDLNKIWKFTEYSYIIETANREDLIVFLLFSWCCFVCAVMFVAFPFVTILINYLSGDPLAYDGTLKHHLFYDVKKLPGFLFAILMESYMYFAYAFSLSGSGSGFPGIYRSRSIPGSRNLSGSGLKIPVF
ncbi:hypothetical protein ACKWTF_008587 [Chironomus riparius]